MTKKIAATNAIQPLRSEADYDAALEEIERYFDKPPKLGTSLADRFGLLAWVIENYAQRIWRIA